MRGGPVVRLCSVALSGLVALAARAEGAETRPGLAGPLDADTARAALERDGRVSYVRYEPSAAPVSEGVTRFVMEFSYAYTYRADRGSAGGRRRLWVTPHVEGQVRWRHTIELPRALADTAAAFRRLRDHELDHVAISLDPRAGMLLHFLVADLGTLEGAEPAGADGVKALVRRLVDEEIGRRKEAVTALIRANYARLDSLTGHGTQPLADREAFFASLYTRENLEALAFPWLARVEPLLARPEYVGARRYALP